MKQQRTEKAQNEEFDPIEWRKSKVLELHTQGLTEWEIADKLQVSPSTVHRDIVELRERAAQGLKEHLQNVPYAWLQTVTSIEFLMKRAFDLFNSQGLEFDQNIELMKIIGDLTTTRLNLHGEPQILDRACGNITKLKAELEAMKKQASQAAYELSIGGEPASGKKCKIVRTTKTKEKMEERPVVV